MVYLKLVYDGEDEVVYDFMPEHKDAMPGRVSVNKKTREKTLIKESPESGNLSWYRCKAAKRICEMLDAGELKQETYMAWY